jgi:hypothetical protein
LIQPFEVAEELPNIFSQCVTILVRVFPFHSLSSEFLSLSPISDSDVFKAFKRLRSSKSVGVYDISDFVIMSSDIFVRVLEHIYNLSLSLKYLPTLWKQEEIVPVFFFNK